MQRECAAVPRKDQDRLDYGYGGASLPCDQTMQTSTQESDSSNPPRPPYRGAGVGAWSRDLFISLAVSLFIILFLYQPVRVEGTSMLPRLEDQDRLFINKFAYRFEQIHHNDVVVFYYPHDHSKSYIKRVIALPGDRLSIDHGTVSVNGVVLNEPYVPEKYQDDRSMPERVIPPDEYFVMGDHRSISSDSRDFGPVPRDLIYGRAALVYWPLDQAGVVR